MTGRVAAGSRTNAASLAAAMRQSRNTIWSGGGILGVTLQELNDDLGAYFNRLEMTAKGLMIAYENTQASESRIRDADMAEEMVGFSKNQILVHTGSAMLAQANIQGQSVMKLLGS